MKKALRGCARLSLVDKVIEPLARRSQLSNLDLFKGTSEFSEFIVVTSIIEGCGKS
jgi:hypothetical protein